MLKSLDFFAQIIYFKLLYVHLMVRYSYALLINIIYISLFYIYIYIS